MSTRSADPVPFPARPARGRRDRIIERLVGWYRTAKRPLPWRETRDPYAIWISEAMLQQTRVETVIPYWRRFLARFPSLSDLARADEDDVLALWSGLGYYRRARSLHAAARAIVERHGGRFPEDRADVLALPGVGPYTAGAVLSIAFDAPEPLVDGNVERVFSRLFDLDAVAGSPELKREAWELAALFVPEGGGAGDWNQAVMELGATVCTPRDPRCAECPAKSLCRARQRGSIHERPRPKPRRAPVDVALEVLIVAEGGRLLLERRPATGRMAGMWQLPTREAPDARGSLSGLFPGDFPADGAEHLVVLERRGEVRHSITHHRIVATVHAGRARGVLAAPYQWFDPHDARDQALTGMTKKVMEGMIPVKRSDLLFE